MYLFTLFTWELLKPLALGGCLHNTCEPVIDEERNPVSESWGKHSITNWSFNEGHHCLCSGWKEKEERDPVVLQNCSRDTIVGERLSHLLLCANFPPELSNFFNFFLFFSNY